HLAEMDHQTAVAGALSRFSSRPGLLATATVSVVAVAIGYAIHTTPPQYAEHVEADRVPMDLPMGASDVSYAQGYRGTIACEFTCDESAFLRWVESGIGSIESSTANISVEPITSPYTLTRYNALMPGGTRESVTVEEGVFYHWSRED